MPLELPLAGTHIEALTHLYDGCTSFTITRKPTPTAPSKSHPPPEKKPAKAVAAKKAGPAHVSAAAEHARKAQNGAAGPEKAHKAAPPAPQKRSPAAAKAPPAPAPAPAAPLDPKLAAKLVAEKDKKSL